MRTVVFTSDKHSWLLRGFLHQWKKYGGVAEDCCYDTDPMQLEIAGFTRPKWLSTWPDEVPFYSIGDFKDFPVDKWSDAVIRYLQKMPGEHFIFLLEDYWMLRPINRRFIFQALSYMATHKEVARFDLTSDRMFATGARFAGSYQDLDICEAKGAYSLSFQASIYSKTWLLKAMVPGETPWQAEIAGSYRLNQLECRVVGSYQWPMNYAIVMNKGEFDQVGSWMYPARTLPRNDWDMLGRLGFTKPGWEDR